MAVCDTTFEADSQLPDGLAAPTGTDLVRPEAADNTMHRPVVIHRAIYGSFERFIAILTEHYAGAFPTWLAPVRVNEDVKGAAQMFTWMAVDPADGVTRVLKQFEAMIERFAARGLDVSAERAELARLRQTPARSVDADNGPAAEVAYLEARLAKQRYMVGDSYTLDDVATKPVCQKDAAEHKLPVHLDGARLFNAAVAAGRPVTDRRHTDRAPDGVSALDGVGRVDVVVGEPLRAAVPAGYGAPLHCGYSFG